MMTKVSVIIPCFNSAKYVHKAINTCLNQSLSEIEIILVDDGSTDQTPGILKQFESGDKRIKVLTHAQNKGLGPARNTGIKAAQGEYIFFLDSDDYLHLNTFEVLYEKAKAENLDILQGQHIRHENEKKQILPRDLIPFPEPVTGTDYFKQAIFIEPKACGKLWNRAFMKKYNLQFPSGFYEDIAVVLYAFSIANRVNNSLFAGYHYIIRPQSITNSPVTTNHIQGMKQSLIDLQALFANQALVDKKSVFPVQYFLYLKELAYLSLKTRDNPLLQKDIKLFIDKQTQKYGIYLKNNRNLPWLKRKLLQKSPFIYAQLKSFIK